MNFKKVKEQVISELNVVPKMTDRAIYNFLCNLLGDPELVKQFMVTEGGYTSGQFNSIVRKKQLQNYPRT